MAVPQTEQFTQALFGKIESVLIVCAVLILVVGIPLIWLRLKLERALSRVIRSARERRQTQKSAANTNSSDTAPHCPVCKALMVKRLARRGFGAGSTFCISLVPTRLDRCPGGFTGHVAHPSRSIGVAAIIPSVAARERFRFLSGVTAPGYSFHRNVTVLIASSEYFVPDIR
jgi:hypothetical protein